MPAYRISAVGFDNREALFLRTTVEMSSGFDTAEWLFVGDKESDVTLVNSDRKKFTSEYIINKPTKNNIRPILIGCHSGELKNNSFSYTLKKPITYSKLTTLLLKIEKVLTETAQTLPPIKEQHEELNKVPRSSVPLKKKVISKTATQSESYSFSSSQSTKDNQEQSNQQAISYQTKIVPSKPSNTEIKNIIDISTGRFIEEDRLLGLLRKPIFLGRPTKITHRIYTPIRVYPKQQLFSYDSNRRLSSNLFTAQATGFSIHELLEPGEQEQPLEQTDNQIIQPLWLLYYLATLYGSEGRLKENNHPNDRLALMSKPNFDIIPNHSDYKAIAEFMIAKEPQDLNAIAYGSGVNINTVIDFCNACEEIDILDRTPFTHSEIRPPTKIQAAPNPETLISGNGTVPDRGLLKRLYQHLSQLNRDKKSVL
ncbi:MAG: hypothetical protein P8179_07030 [Candidatus Thiodiazotropha sp.]|jgi:hypothetical protein